ncbi:hypothetical protein L6V77_19415 [Myxococcota bacterium]|nr:hypothetical protein [Myxococcota bacterium]
MSVPVRLDARGRAAFLEALGDVLTAGDIDVEAALGLVGAAGPESGTLARAITARMRAGRHLAAALSEAGCVTPAEADALRALTAPEQQAAALRLLVMRRAQRRRRLRAMGTAASTPLALTFVTVLALQAPLLLLDAATPAAAARPPLVFLALAGALLLLGRLVVLRAGPGFWTRAAGWPVLGHHLVRRAEIELALALAALGRDDGPSSAAYSVAAVLVAPAGHAEALRRLAAAGDRAPGHLVTPWHPALCLAIVGGAAAGRLRERCTEWAREAEATLTSRWVLAVRLVAYVVLFVVSSWAATALLDTEIKLPGLEGLPGLDGLDLTDPAGALDRILMKELQ